MSSEMVNQDDAHHDCAVVLDVEAQRNCNDDIISENKNNLPQKEEDILQEITSPLNTTEAATHPVVFEEEKEKEKEKDSNKKNAKKKDRKLLTQNILMMKKVIDDPNTDGGLILVGTFVQKVFGLTEEEAKKGFYFGYRFNEKTANDETLQKRRTEFIETTDGNGNTLFGSRTTFQAMVPLDLDMPFKAFPYHIVTATAAIELSSTFEGKTTIRPDLLLHKEDSRNNISIQELKPGLNKALLFGGDAVDEWWSKDYTLEDKIAEKLDQTKKWDFISPYPRIYYEHDNAKGYCPRYVVTFYCYVSGATKLITFILPIFLVFFIALLNVINDYSLYISDSSKFVINGTMTDNITGTVSVLGGDAIEHGEGADVLGHLQVMAALTLAAVFILPNIIDQSNRMSIYSAENIYVILIFVSLLLSSFPGKLLGTKVPETIGVSLLFLSFLIPLSSVYRFGAIEAKIEKEMHELTENHRFLNDRTYKRWSEKMGGLLDKFATVDYFLNTDSDLYAINKIEEEVPKITRLWYAHASAKKKSIWEKIESVASLSVSLKSRRPSV